METLLKAIVVWVSANMSIPIPANFDLPTIEYVRPAKMAEIALHGQHSAAQKVDEIPDTVAIYDDERRTIILPVGWSGEHTREGFSAGTRDVTTCKT